MDSEKVITAEKVEESENVVQDSQPQENDQATETQKVSENNPSTEDQESPENGENPEPNVIPEDNQAPQEKASDSSQNTLEDKKPEESEPIVEAEKIEEATQTIGHENVKEENIDEATQTSGQEKVTEEDTQTAKEEGTETEKAEKTEKVEEGDKVEDLEKAAEEQKSEEEETLEAKYTRIIGEAKKLYDDVLPLDQWEFYGEKNGIKSYTRTDPVTGIKMVRGEGTINRPASKFWEVVVDPKRIRNWETNLCSHEKIDTVGDNIEVYRSLDQKRMFVTQRETLIASKMFKQEDGTILTIQRSCDHPNVPEVNNLVRASVGLFAWQFVPDKEDENITQTTCMLYIDIKGSVPTMLFNMFVSDMAQNVLKLKNYVEKAF